MLPPVFSITPEILRLVAELDEFKGQWRMIRSLSPEKLTSLRKVTEGGIAPTEPGSWNHG